MVNIYARLHTSDSANSIFIPNLRISNIYGPNSDYKLILISTRSFPTILPIIVNLQVFQNAAEKKKKPNEFSLIKINQTFKQRKKKRKEIVTPPIPHHDV